MSTQLRLADDLLLPLKVVTEKLAWLGRTGSGKTYGAQKLAEEMHRAGAQFVALDPVGVWFGLRLDADGKSPGLPVPVLGGLRGDIPLEATGGALVADLVIDRGVSIVLDVSQFESDADKARFATAFADRFFFRKKASPSAVHLFVEECQEFVPQNPQREEARMLHAFTRLVKIGRNFGIGVSLISQRPQEINKKVLNLTELLFAFQMTGPQERKTIQGWIAEKGIDEDIAGELPKLEVGHPHVWSPAWLRISRVVKILPKRTADVSSTPTVGQRNAPARDLSPIDLDRLRDDMKATIEKAKAEDPRELQRQVRELKAQIAKAPTVTAAKERRVEVKVHVLSEPLVRRLEVATRKLTAAEERHEKAAQLVVEGQGRVVAALGALHGRLEAVRNPGAHNMLPAARNAAAGQPIPVKHFTAPPRPTSAHQRAARASLAPPSDGLTGPQQAILDVVGMLGVRGLTPDRDMVARWLGLHPRGGTHNTNLALLRAGGYLDGLLLTEKGAATARHTDTGLDAALAALDGEPKRAIVRVLIDAGKPLSREELAERLSLHPRGGTHNTNLSRLRAMGLITERGPITTTDGLFR